MDGKYQHTLGLALFLILVGVPSVSWSADGTVETVPRELQVVPAPDALQEIPQAKADVVPTAFLTPSDVHDVVLDRYQRMPFYGNYRPRPQPGHVRNRVRVNSHEVVGWFCYIKGNGPAKWAHAE